MLGGIRWEEGILLILQEKRRGLWRANWEHWGDWWESGKWMGVRPRGPLCRLLLWAGEPVVASGWWHLPCFTAWITRVESRCRLGKGHIYMFLWITFFIQSPSQGTVGTGGWLKQSLPPLISSEANRDGESYTQTAVYVPGCREGKRRKKSLSIGPTVHLARAHWSWFLQALVNEH